MVERPSPSSPEGPLEQDVDPRHRWHARPWLSFGLRAAAILVPAASAAGTAVLLGMAAPSPDGPLRAAWVAWILVAATLVAYLVERAVRRVLPLAVLLELSLAFPDRAPSRFAMARSAGNVRRLQERIDDARRRGVDDDPARAAGQILELVAALSAHDRKTRGHSERVRAYTDMLAGELGLCEADRDRLRWAALLHDIGKLHVPGRILNKPGKPDRYEWERLKQHPLEGARIAAPLLPWLGTWAAAIAQHHERFDGTGYPAGLAGGEIGLGARVVSVADSFEVMTAARAYKKPMSVAAARRELARCAGAQFDPGVVRSFLDISIGRLWWRAGPASWLAVTPVLGWLQRSAGQVVIAAKSAAVVTVLGVGAAVNTVHASPRSSAPATAVAADASGADAPAASEEGEEPHGPSGSSEQGSGSGTEENGGGGPVDPGEAEPEPPQPEDPGDPGVDPGSDVDDIIRSIPGTVHEVGDAVEDVVQTVTDPVDQVIDDVTSAVPDAVGDVTDALGPLLPRRSEG